MKRPQSSGASILTPTASLALVLVLSAGLHGNVIRTLMPLVMTDEELDEALTVLESCLEDAG